MQARVQERLVGGFGTALVVGALGYMLIVGMRVDQRFHIEQPIALFTVQPPPPPPIRHPVEVRKASRASGKASPRNLRNKAAEIVKPPPPPVVIPLPPPPVIAAPKAGQGMAASAGASDRPGPGEGAGGVGNGNGGGGSGDGDGDETPPRLKKGKLKFADLPPDLRGTQTGGLVAVRYDVGIDGRVSNCVATASSGNRALDRATCDLIEQRFRYAPSRDAAHRPVPSTIEETHNWIVTPDPTQ